MEWYNSKVKPEWKMEENEPLKIILCFSLIGKMSWLTCAEQDYYCWISFCFIKNALKLFLHVCSHRMKCVEQEVCWFFFFWFNRWLKSFFPERNIDENQQMSSIRYIENVQIECTVFKHIQNDWEKLIQYSVTVAKHFSFVSWTKKM